MLSFLWLHLTVTGTGAKGHTLVLGHAQMRKTKPRAALPASTWQTLPVTWWHWSPCTASVPGLGRFVSWCSHHPASLLLLVVGRWLPSFSISSARLLSLKCQGDHLICCSVLAACVLFLCYGPATLKERGRRLLRATEMDLTMPETSLISQVSHGDKSKWWDDTTAAFIFFFQGIY